MFAMLKHVSETLTPLDLDAYALDAALRKALKLSERWLAMPPVELKSLVQEIVDRITVAADRIEIQLSRAKIAAALQVGERGQRPDLDPVVLSIEAKVRRAGKGSLFGCPISALKSCARSSRAVNPLGGVKGGRARLEIRLQSRAATARAQPNPNSAVSFLKFRLTHYPPLRPLARPQLPMLCLAQCKGIWDDFHHRIFPHQAER